MTGAPTRVARILPDDATESSPGAAEGVHAASDGPAKSGTRRRGGAALPWRLLRRRGFAVTAVLLLLGFLVTGTSAANASPEPVMAVCIGDDYYNYQTQSSWNEITASLSSAEDDTLWQPDINANTRQIYEATPPEWYGTTLAWTSAYKHGTNINPSDEECGGLDGVVSSHLPSAILGLSSGIVWVVASVYTWATDPHLMDTMLKPVDCIVAGTNSVSPVEANGSGGCQSEGLVNALYLNFMIPVLGLGAIWALWNGLVKRRTTQALQGALWMVVTATLGIIFLLQPTWVAVKMNYVVTKFNNVVLGAVTQGAADRLTGQPNDDLCYLRPRVSEAKHDENGNVIFDLGEFNNAGRRANCILWKQFVYSPWMFGQFGPDADARIAIANDTMRDELVRKFPQLTAKAAANLPLAQMEATLTDHDDKIRIATCADLDNTNSDEDPCRIFPNRDGEPVSLSEAGLSRFEAIFDQMDTQANLSGVAQTWAGRGIASRFNAAFTSLVAAIGGGIVVLILSLLSVLYQVGLMMLIIVAPLVLLFGLHPGFGRRLTLKYLETVLGLGVKRMLSLMLITIIIAMMGIINTIDTGWFQKVMLIIVISVAVLMYRKTLTQMLTNFNFTGQGEMQSQGEARRFTGAATTSVVAVGAAAAAGGGVGAMVSAGARGATMGRSSSPMMATRVGMGAGRNAANRSKARKNANRQSGNAPNGSFPNSGRGGPPPPPPGGGRRRGTGAPNTSSTSGSGSGRGPGGPGGSGGGRGGRGGGGSSSSGSGSGGGPTAGAGAGGGSGSGSSSTP